MRIHPLTRVMDNSEDQQRIVEVRIEFSDQFGSTTRSAGQLRLELIDRGAGGDVVEEWNNDLRSESSNALHFDDITRTYLFRLELDSQYSTRDAELRAYFLSIDNSRLTATHRFQR